MNAQDNTIQIIATDATPHDVAPSDAAPVLAGVELTTTDSAILAGQFTEEDYAALVNAELPPHVAPLVAVIPTAPLEEAVRADAPKTNEQPRQNRKSKNKPSATVSPTRIQDLQDALNGAKPKNIASLLGGNRPVREAVSQVIRNRAASGSVDRTPEQEGVTHINCQSTSNTKLGKFLDINAQAEFTHPELGKFASLGGFWFYLRTEEPVESLRAAHGSRCKYIAQRLKMIQVDNFRAIVAEAALIKILSNEAMMQELVESTLPFTLHYVNDSGLPQPSTEELWYCHALEIIRTALKTFVATGATTLEGLYDFSGLDRLSQVARFQDRRPTRDESRFNKKEGRNAGQRQHRA